VFVTGGSTNAESEWYVSTTGAIVLDTTSLVFTEVPPSLVTQVQPTTLFEDGSEALPSIAFDADPDTGMWRFGANHIAWSVGGVTRLGLDSTGLGVNGSVLVGTLVSTPRVDGVAFSYVASGSTTDIGAATYDSVEITGNTTINSFGSFAAGTRRFCRIIGSPAPLIVASSSIVCPNGVSIQCQPYDTFIAQSFGSGVWQIVSYTRYSGKALYETGTTYVANRAYDAYYSNSDISTVIPLDDTPPLISEGVQVLQATVSPSTAAKRVRVRAVIWGAAGTNNYLIAAAFLNGEASASRAACAFTGPSGLTTCCVVIEHEYAPGTTSAQTWQIRVGTNSGTARLNGSTSGRYFGGTGASTLIVEEIP
jgi:hypothetical protein